MPKPQQPELRRSGFTVLDPDSVASELDAHDRPGTRPGGGPVPEDNLPGHHPAEEQDKPAGDDFVARARAVAESANGNAEVETADRDEPPTQTSAPRATQTSAPRATADPVVDPAGTSTRTEVGGARRRSSTQANVAATLAGAPFRLATGFLKGLRRTL